MGLAQDEREVDERRLSPGLEGIPISHLLGRVLRLVRPLGASSRSFSDVIGWPKMKERLHDANDRPSVKQLDGPMVKDERE